MSWTIALSGLFLSVLSVIDCTTASKFFARCCNSRRRSVWRASASFRSVMSREIEWMATGFPSLSLINFELTSSVTRRPSFDLNLGLVPRCPFALAFALKHEFVLRQFVRRDKAVHRHAEKLVRSLSQYPLDRRD